MIRTLGMSTLLSVMAQGAVAEPVLLKSLDGRMSVNGEVIGSDGETATVQSDLGVVNVPIALMTCAGAACETDIGWAEVILPAMSKELTVAVRSEQELDILHALKDALNEAPDFEVASSDAALGAETLTIENPASRKTVSLQVMPGASSASIRFVTSAEAAAEATGLDLDQAPNTQLVGMGAFNVIAHKDVNVDAISMEQLAQIYSGEISNWSELGGADSKIVALKPEPDSDDLSDFETLVMAPHERAIGAEILAVSGDDKIAQYVDRFPGGIGVVNASYAETDNVIPVLSSCGAHEMATPFGIASGDYPLARPVFAVHGDEADGTTVALFDQASSEVAQSALSQIGLLETKVNVALPAAKSLRLKAVMETEWPEAQLATAKELAQLMLVSNRLSATFRAGELTAGDAAWNRKQLLLLSEFLKSGAYDGYEVVLAGFSGGDATPEAAKASADEVMEALRSRMSRVIDAGTGPTAFTSMGFDALTSTDCAPSNRNRVEVWVRKAGVAG